MTALVQLMTGRTMVPKDNFAFQGNPPALLDVRLSPFADARVLPLRQLASGFT